MGKRKFTLFHLSLLPVRQVDIETRDLSREQWMRDCFSRHFSFPYRVDNEIHWVPASVAHPDGIISGHIQMQKPHTLHLPPEDGGSEYTTREWQGAFTVVDPVPHADGQRVAVENDVVGLPQSLLRYLFDHLNSRPERPFDIEFDPVFSGDEFWKFSEKHSHKVRYVKFYFSSPNMWGAESELDRELAKTREETGAQRIGVTMESSEGVLTRSQKVVDGVNYAEKGAGTITAKALTGETFSSSRKKRTTEIPPPTDETDMLKYLQSMYHKILGRTRGEDFHGSKNALDNSNNS
ncbi:hypothetical protein [Rhodobacter capsulatus]|uniref:hypothetical protein n=1 Tax=Rhodobacter capsulatus TaxID=1061 RepID=UPI004028E4D3